MEILITMATPPNWIVVRDSEDRAAAHHVRFLWSQIQQGNALEAHVEETGGYRADLQQVLLNPAHVVSVAVAGEES